MIAHRKDLSSGSKKPKHPSVREWLYASVALMITVALVVAVFGLSFWGRIYPGVNVEGVTVGGLTTAQAKAVINQRIGQLPVTYVLTGGGKSWRIDRQQLGLTANVDKTAEKAWLVGRKGGFLGRVGEVVGSILEGSRVQLEIDWREDTFQNALLPVAAAVEKPPENPGVMVDNGSVIVSRGQDGEVLRRDLLKEELEQRIRQFSGDSNISLQTENAKVELSDSEAEALRSRSEKLLGSLLTLTYPAGPEEESVVLTDKELVGFLVPTFSGEIDDLKVANYVGDLTGVVNRLPENAVFQFVAEKGKVTVFKPSEDGVSLDKVKASEEISTKIQAMSENGEKKATVELPVIKIPPTVTTDSVNNLGIKELLGRGVSYFFGSIQGRIHNIALGTSRLNGALIAPGEEFSFNKTIGDISAETGYQQAYVIKAGRTVLGDGGGVCQISTTLFRAVLAAGLPVVERWAHAYRVHYYEEGSQLGLDATVYSPSVDLKFKNDTGAYILIQASVDEKKDKVTFDLYGTSDGRQSTISKTRVWDVTPPPPDLYQDDPTLPVGVVKQVDFSAWGAKTAFDWTVARGSEILEKRTFYSNYQPWQAVYLKGTRQP